ncbi:hypothetical protein SHDE107825_19665 [Shewanella denitrificans]
MISLETIATCEMQIPLVLISTFTVKQIVKPQSEEKVESLLLALLATQENGLTNILKVTQHQQQTKRQIFLVEVMPQVHNHVA